MKEVRSKWLSQLRHQRPYLHHPPCVLSEFIDQSSIPTTATLLYPTNSFSSIPSWGQSLLPSDQYMLSLLPTIEETAHSTVNLSRPSTLDLAGFASESLPPSMPKDGSPALEEQSPSQASIPFPSSVLLIEPNSVSTVPSVLTQICKGKFEQVRKTNLVPAATHH